MKIKEVTVELQLPQSMTVHDIFHPNLLKKISTEFLTPQTNKLSLLIIINNMKNCEVEDIFDTSDQYQVK